MKVTLHEDQYTFFISLSILRRMKNFSDRSCRESRDAHFMFNNFLAQIVPFMRYVEKCCRAGQATDNNMAHAHCMLDT
jgi:hypothetical protein